MCDPFIDNVDYLDHQFSWLRFRARRIVQERAPKPVTFPIPKPPQPDDWRLHEHKALTEIRERLEIHQADPDASVLGLELLRSEQGLTNDEVLILVACTAVAISTNLANDVLGELCGAPYGVQVEDLWALMDPCCAPHGLEQLLAFRAYFRPESSKLIKAGLISVDIKEGASPAELSGAWVQLTGKGFKAITGVEP